MPCCTQSQLQAGRLRPFRAAPAASLFSALGNGTGSQLHSLRHEHRRLYTASAAPMAASNAVAAADIAAEALPQEVEAALPHYCAGCGIRLQRDDADAPGCVRLFVE